MTRDSLSWVVEDLIQLGVGMVTRDGRPWLTFDDADAGAKWAAEAVQGALAEHRDEAVQLFKRGGGCGGRLPVQCAACRGWVYSLSAVRSACELPTEGLTRRRCEFRPT